MSFAFSFFLFFHSSSPNFFSLERAFLFSNIFVFCKKKKKRKSVIRTVLCYTLIRIFHSLCLPRSQSVKTQTIVRDTIPSIPRIRLAILPGKNWARKRRRRRERKLGANTLSLSLSLSEERSSEIIPT